MRIHGSSRRSSMKPRRSGQAHRLRKKGDQERGDLERRLVDSDAAIGVAVEQRGGFRDALRQLRRTFFALVGERADVARIFIETGEGDVEALLVVEMRPGVGEQAGRSSVKRGCAG